MKKTSAFQNSLIWFGAAVSIAEILTDEGRPTRGYHVTHWRDRNLKGANK